MSRENSFNLMCSEIIKILEYCPKSDVAKIPERLMKCFRENQLKNAQIEIDHNKSIFEQNVSENTLVMAFIIFRNCWATEEEKKEVDKILYENQIKVNELYSLTKGFDNPKEITTELEDSVNNMKVKEDLTNNKNAQLMEYEKTVINKIINVIRKIFKTKNTYKDNVSAEEKSMFKASNENVSSAKQMNEYRKNFTERTCEKKRDTDLTR